MGFWKRPASETQITHGDRIWLYVVVMVVMLLLILPALIVAPMSFSDSQYLEFPPSHWSLRWYDEYFESTKWMRCTMTSLQIGVLTMLVATPLGTMAAYALYVSGHPAARAIFIFLITPMIVPVILIAIGTFYVFGRIGLNNTISGLVLAHTALATPLVMIIIIAALRTYDLNQERVARSLGASRLKAFFLITLPQIRFSILTVALLSFLTSFDEVIISIFISGGVNATLTKQMFSALRDYIDPTIATVSTI
ncbi:MAG: ABC transporter permease, partial [Pseudomonadales bacterium]|nr:ABC transporter permease [Pseudomonadales bacterium]